MMINHVSDKITSTVMGFWYYGFFKACYFAGLYRAAKISPLSYYS